MKSKRIFLPCGCLAMGVMPYSETPIYPYTYAKHLKLNIKYNRGVEIICGMGTCQMDFTTRGWRGYTLKEIMEYND